MASTSVFSPTISTIRASTTASLRSTYIPPFATSSTFVASITTINSLSTGRPSQIYTGNPSNPSVPALQDDLDWVSTYLVIHSLSQNSYIYAYIFWMGVALVFGAMTVLHSLGARGGAAGAWWSKWALRRRTWRKKHSLRAGHKQPWSLPSNAQMLSLILLFLVVAALCVAGPDYLNPNASLFDFSIQQSSNSNSKAKRRSAFDPSVIKLFQAQYTISKSLWSSAARTGSLAVALLPLTVLLALKAPPFALFATPFTAQIHFDKLVRLHRWAGRIVWVVVVCHIAMWCVQLGRDKRSNTGKDVWTYVFLYNKFIFGWVAFGALTILMILSIRPIRNMRYPVFYFSHIALTPIVLVFVALHHPPVQWWAWAALAIWAGERLWRATWWVYNNGIFGLGERQFVVPPAAMASSEMKRSSTEKTALSSMPAKGARDASAHESWEMSPISPTPRHHQDSSTHSLTNTQPVQQQHLQAAPNALNLPNRASFGFWDSRYLDKDGMHTPAASIDSVGFDWDDHRGAAGTPSSYHSRASLHAAGHAGISPIPSPVPGVGLVARHVVAATPPVVVPPGFAHATLLPGRTIRLRIVPRGVFTWAPGQHVLVGIPAISKLSTHPFSITSVCDELGSGPQVGGSSDTTTEKGENGNAGNAVVSGDGTDLIVLVRAKKGWTRRLWQLVEGMQARGEHVLPSETSALPKGYTASLQRSGQSPGDMSNTGPVLLRALIDGPFGSTARARWGVYSSVLIVAGGSGVSYGMSILEYYCLCLSGRDGRFLGTKSAGGWGTKKWQTQRVRFVWLVREYSHVQWCATALRRCLALLPSTDALEINIFVTNFKPPRDIRPSSYHFSSALAAGEDDDTLLPPAPRFAQKSGKRRPVSGTSSIMSDSESSIASEDSHDSYADLDYYFSDLSKRNSNVPGLANGEMEDDNGLGHEEHVLDYTNFDGDDDEPLPGENKFSRKLKKEGKLRRAKTKKAIQVQEEKKKLKNRTSVPPGPSSHNATTRNTSMLSPSGHTALPRPTSGVAIQVYPETPVRTTALASDPLLASSSTSPPASPSAEDMHAQFSSMQGQEQGLHPSGSGDTASGRVHPSPPSRLSMASADHPPSSLSQSSLRPQRPPMPGRPVSTISNLTTSSFDLRSPVDHEGSSRWLDLHDGGKSGLKIDAQELQDIRIVSEVTRPGKPRLDKIIENEVERAKGRILVACCGPTSLNALMRKHVAKQISPARIRKGDMRGCIDFLSEDFEY